MLFQNTLPSLVHYLKVLKNPSKLYELVMLYVFYHMYSVIQTFSLVKATKICTFE